MIRLLLPLLMALALAGPAEAHRLKVFATVEGTQAKGYAFFIGGGRAEQTPWVAKDATGSQIARGTTDDEGRFAFAVVPPPASDITVTVDTREGHIAFATLPAARFAGGVPSASKAATETPAAAAPPEASIDARVEAAVQRQVEPLMEQIDRMESRLRFTDMVSGVFLILGLAGMALWAKGRRR
jgi:nickel transport protein